ncbi:MAG: pilin, partial [Candidatus Gracilibacteria bacterium]|nr:pilin [Candidatus Gracilibacteria bacterium]
LLPLSFALAATNPPPIIGGTLLPGVNAGISQQTGSTQGEKELNWLQNVFFKNTINKLIGWTAALSVVFLIIGGYQYLTAIGNDDQIKKAHKTITWSLIGVALAMLAFAIVQIVVNLKFSNTSANLLSAAVTSSYSKELQSIIPCFGGSCAVSEVAALPQGDFRDEFLPTIARFLIYAMGAVSFIIFFVAGAILVFSWGEEDLTKKAKNAIVWGITGIAFAAASYLLVKGISSIDYMKTSTSTTTSQSTAAAAKTTATAAGGTDADGQAGYQAAQNCLSVNDTVATCKSCCADQELNTFALSSCNDNCIIVPKAAAATATTVVAGEGGAACGGGKGTCKNYGTGWSGCWAGYSAYDAGAADCRSEKCCVLDPNSL